MSILLRRLTPGDMEQVVALEYQLFPREFCYSVAKTEEVIAIPHVQGKNYSVGAFDGERLVGYVLMFDAPSEFCAAERVALVWELATAMRYRPLLSKPFMDWIIREAHRCGQIVEARLRERTALRMLTREAGMVGASQYRVTNMVQHKPIGTERMLMLRFEPVHAPRHGLRAAIDQAGIAAERARRAGRLLPLRLVRRACYAVPQYVPKSVLQRTYLLPRGAEPSDVRTDVG